MIPKSKNFYDVQQMEVGNIFNICYSDMYMKNADISPETTWKMPLAFNEE